MQKLLVTGVDTVIGANLVLSLQDRWQISAVGASALGNDWGAVVPCDLSDPLEVAERLTVEAPACVIHCGDFSRPSWDAEDVEIDAAHAAHNAGVLAAACQQCGIHFCVITSDSQFVGPRMFHAETHPATSIGSVADASRAVEAAVAPYGALIVRTHAYGWSAAGDDASFVQRIWRSLSDGRDCPVDGDRYATPILVSDLAEHLHEAIAQRWRGVYHISGVERANQRRFAAELAVAFGFTGRVVPLVAPDRPIGRRLVDETSLNTGLARQVLNAPLPMLREGLARFADQAETGYRERLDSLAFGALQHQRAA